MTFSIKKETLIAIACMMVFAVATVACDQKFGWGLTFWHRVAMNMVVYFAVHYTASRHLNKNEGAH